MSQDDDDLQEAIDFRRKFIDTSMSSGGDDVFAASQADAHLERFECGCMVQFAKWYAQKRIS